MARAKLPALLRRADAFHVLDHVAAAILDHPPAAGLARQLAVEGQLDAFLPAVLDAREADHVRHHFTRGVIAPVFVLLVDAGKLQRRDPVCHVGRQLALDVDEIAFRGQLAIDLAHVEFEQARQTACLGRRQFDILGHGPDRAHRRRYRQHVAVAVGDATPRRRNVDHALEAGASLVGEEIVVEGLQVERAADQREEGTEQCHQHHALPPLRQAL
jgi:hypothetical protein